MSSTSYTGRSEAVWSPPSEPMLSSASGTSGTSFTSPLNQSKNLVPCNQQLLMGSACNPPETSYIRSNHLAHGYSADAGHGFGSVEMPSTFAASTGSQPVIADRNVGQSFAAVALRSPAARSRQDYIGSYSPLTASTPAVVMAPSVQSASHLPANEWGSATVLPANSGPRSHNLPSASWQNMHQPADNEFTANARAVYLTAMPQTSSVSPLQASMQYSTVSSVVSPNASSTSGVPSPANSPYSPSLHKPCSEPAGGDAIQLPFHMQPHYLESLLQLHYLLLASNKLLAPRCPPSRFPPSLGGPRFDTYIPGGAASAARPTVFDFNRLSSSPGNFQHGFNAARFPRLVFNDGLQERHH